LEPPFTVALIVAVWDVVTVALEPVNVAVLDPAATVTEAGTVTAALLTDSVTAVPPEGAAALNVVVQVEVPGATTDVGEQLSPLIAGCQPCTVMAPPVPLTATGSPEGRTPSTFVMPTARVGVLTDDARVTVTVATGPLVIALPFIPAAKQTTEALPLTQVNVFPAAVIAAPGATATEATLLEAYVSVHCRPAGTLVAAVNARFNEIAPPAAADPDARVSEFV
jgi:hypothetical protein